MPVYKAIILNKEINVNYDESQKTKLIDAINEINSKLKTYDNQKGKISDNKLLSFLAIKLQAELLDFKEHKINETYLEKNYNEKINENIELNDKVFELNVQNEKLNKENQLMNQELNNIQNQIDIILKLIKKTYEE